MGLIFRYIHFILANGLLNPHPGVSGREREWGYYIYRFGDRRLESGSVCGTGVGQASRVLDTCHHAPNCTNLVALS